MDKKKRYYWIDMAKLVAILGVLVDHTYWYLYRDSNIAYASYYSVSLFIIIMGVTSYLSYSDYEGSVLKKVFYDCWKIYRPYLAATFIYGIVIDKKFDFLLFLSRTLFFNGNVAFYYVLLYMQLIIITPVLLMIINKDFSKRSIIGEILGFIIIVFVAYLTTNYSNIMGIYGGGGKLFGGTYLILLYIGIIFGKVFKHVRLSQNVSLIASLLIAVAILFWWRFISIDRCALDLNIPFGDGFNPPSISFALYAILVCCFIFMLEKSLCNRAWLLRIYSTISSLGKHTLYIFLYHRLFLEHFFGYFLGMTGLNITNIWVMRGLYYSVMIAGSLLLEYCIKKIYSVMKSAYKMSN